MINMHSAGLLVDSLAGRVSWQSPVAGNGESMVHQTEWCRHNSAEHLTATQRLMSSNLGEAAEQAILFVFYCSD